jgi:hypothetical protein
MTSSNPTVGNWSAYVQDFVKGKESASYLIGRDTPDPFYGCLKEFTASYQCGNIPTMKTINIPGEAGGKSALFDCSNENKMCKGFRLTLGDDGNLVLSDSENKQIWTSNTSTTGLIIDKFSAKNSKYGRNYLLAGETLTLGEFIGSPSGNCYLIMEATPAGNGLQLNYTVANCDDNQVGNDDSTYGLFSLAKTAYNELIGSKNKITPGFNYFNETIEENDKAFSSEHSQMKENIHDYMGIRETRPLIKEHIQQLTAMGEDTDLFLIRYKYRRMLWLTVVIIVILGGIKIARNN